MKREAKGYPKYRMDNDESYKFLKDAYVPYQPVTALQQMTMQECIENLEQLHCQYFGKRFGMALGIAINTLKHRLMEKNSYGRYVYIYQDKGIILWSDNNERLTQLIKEQQGGKIFDTLAEKPKDLERRLHAARVSMGVENDDNDTEDINL